MRVWVQVQAHALPLTRWLVVPSGQGSQPELEARPLRLLNVLAAHSVHSGHQLLVSTYAPGAVCTEGCMPGCTEDVQQMLQVTLQHKTHAASRCLHGCIACTAYTPGALPDPRRVKGKRNPSCVPIFGPQR